MSQISTRDMNDMNDATESQSPPRVYLLLENPRKSNNLGPILRCAAAFAVFQIVAVGYETCATEGSHGAAKHVSMIAFPTIEQAVSYLRSECKCTSLVGLLGGVADAYESDGYSVYEQDDLCRLGDVSTGTTSSTMTLTNNKRSYPIYDRPFRQGNCCFVVSKNSKGLPSLLAEHCDFFVHVPHANLMASSDASSSSSSSGRLLDTPSCLSISLHHFTSWAHYDERSFQGHKFDVGQKRQVSQEEQESKRAARAEARREMTSEEAMGDGLFGDLEPSGDY